VSVSFSNETTVALEGYGIFPKDFTLDSYKYVFKNPTTILNAYKITITVSIMYMVLSTFFTALIAYPLTKPNLKGRNFINFYLYFTTLFGGGLVPTYILITRYLHLVDTVWVYVLPGMISPWNIFMMRTFFKNIPAEISESAYIDGASEYRIFFQIIIPLSKPVIATVALLEFLGKWNDWNTSMLYINKEQMMSLQYQLQRIMKNIELLQSGEEGLQNLLSAEKIPSETARMAMAVVVAGPALVIFPFFQKYFVKGLTVGSVKG
jgi:putative aldouronate transport system permease protein